MNGGLSTVEDRIRQTLHEVAGQAPVVAPKPRTNARSIAVERRQHVRRRVGVAVVTLVAVIAAGVAILSTIGHGPGTTGHVTTAGPSGAWSELPLGPLEARSGHYSVWTGREMLIWAGLDLSRDPTASPYGTSQFTDGAAYNPATRRWRRIAEPPFKLFYTNLDAPGVLDPPAVWTGTEMLVFGSRPDNTSPQAVGGGALAYNPASNRWRILATPPAGMNLYASAAVWTGQRVVIFGGPNTGLNPPPSPANNNGIGSVSVSSLGVSASYDPHTNRWSSVAAFPLDPRSFETAAWTGHEVIIWGGDDPAHLPLNNGAAYDPHANRWRTLPTAPIAGRSLQRSVWTGHELVIWGGQYLAVSLGDGAAYNPHTNQWRHLAPSPLTARQPNAMIWTGKQAIITGGVVRQVVAGNSIPDTLATDAAAYDPASDTWQKLPAPPFTVCGGQTGLWDGKQALFWGGQQCPIPNIGFPAKTNRGLSYSP
jgi:N-acetylneuraminic acid mutarotase